MRPAPAAERTTFLARLERLFQPCPRFAEFAMFRTEESREERMIARFRVVFSRL